MDKNAASSPTTKSMPPCAPSPNRGQRRLAAVSIGSTILILAVVLFALGQGWSTNFESNSDYALTASAAGAYGGEDAYLPPVLPTLPPDKALPTGTAPSAPDVTDRAKTQAVEQKSSTVISNVPSPAEAHAVHDGYCNFYAQAVTGNVTPDQAAQRAQANGAIVGAIGGALLGAMFGGSGEHPGRSTALGASAGLAAGTAIGSSNAQLAADDIRKRYDEAYSTCMNQQDVPGATQSGS